MIDALSYPEVSGGLKILFFFFRAASEVCESSQARGLIGAVATCLCHSNARSELRLPPKPQFMAMLDP